MKCPDCPCPSRCPGGIFCDWLWSENTVLRAAVAARCNPPEPAVLAAQASRPEVRAAVETQRKIGACPYRSTVGCGCAGARCGLKIDPLGPVATPRRWAIVSHRDCAACIERYGD